MSKTIDPALARPALPAKWRDWRRRIYTGFAYGAAVCTVGAFIESFTGLTVWSLHHGMAGWVWKVPALALLSPLMVDVVTLGGEALWLLAVMQDWDWRARWAGIIMTAGGLAVSVAGNTGRDGWHVPPETLVTYAIAPLSMAAMTGAGLIIVKRHFGRVKHRRRRTQQQPPEPAQVPVPGGESPAPAPVAGHTATRPHLVPPPAGQAAQAEADARAHWAGHINTGTVPGVREVRATLHCGQPRAERTIAAIERLAQRRGA